MIIYEVNLEVDHDVLGEFEPWLKKHVEEMLTIELIDTAFYFKVHESGNQFVCQYAMESLETLTKYYQDYADRMRADGLEKFPGKFTAHRRVLLSQ